MFKRIFVGAALMLAACAHLPATAADLAPVAQAYAANAYTPFNWTGVYVGAHAGWIHNEDKITDTNGGVNPGPFTIKGNSFLGGAQIGYNYQFDPLPIVLGVEARGAYAGSNAKGTIGSANAASHQDLVLDNGFLGDLTVRAGYSFDLGNGSALLPYIKGGLAYYSGKAWQQTTNPGYATIKTDNFTGFTIGGGLEYAIDTHWSVAGEVMYTKYGKQRGGQRNNADPTSPPGYVFNNSHDVNNVRALVAVNYRF